MQPAHISLWLVLSRGVVEDAEEKSMAIIPSLLSMQCRNAFRNVWQTLGNYNQLEEVTCCEDTSEKQMGFLAEPVGARW
jgi:hypothetical protein